jgi:hypothetical protein
MTLWWEFFLGTLFHLLEEPGCPACRARDNADERLVFALVTEHYSDGATLDAMGASWGPCAVHLRQILDTSQAPYALRALYEAAVGRALAAPRGTTALCPLCRESRRSEYSTLVAVTRALRAAPVSDAYAAGGGFCVAHAGTALTIAGRRSAHCILRTLLASLAHAADVATLVSSLAGTDPDAPRRRAARARLGSVKPPDPSAGTLERLQQRLTVPACPICLATGLSERSLLCWLVAQQRDNPHGLVAEALWLCRTHLSDLFAESPSTADWTAKLMRIHLAAELDDVEHALVRAPRVFVNLRRQLEPVTRQRPCFFCDALAGVETSEQALLAAALADGPTSRRYEMSHGICARHARVLPETAVSAQRVLDARLRILLWELEEAGRKSAWPARSESPGPERGAWRRAAAQLDGRAFLGAPA